MWLLFHLPLILGGDYHGDGSPLWFSLLCVTALPLRDERRHGLDRAGERELMDGGLAARLAQPDRAGDFRCGDAGGAGERLCYGRVWGRACGDDWDCGLDVVAAGFDAAGGPLAGSTESSCNQSSSHQISLRN